MTKRKHSLFLCLNFFVLIGLLLSCSSEPELNCEEDNLIRLSTAGEKFIKENLESDKETQRVKISNFKFEDKSCYSQKGSNIVDFKLLAESEEKGKVKKIKFGCTTQRDKAKGKIVTRCQLVF